MLLFALPNVLPAPPGLSGVLGLPLLYLSVQMMLGRVPWLPGFIGDRAMPRDRFAQLVERLGPLLARAERLLRPRWSILVSHGAERVLGALCLVLAAVLALPIPFGNMLPAFAICLIALGILERDGNLGGGGNGRGSRCAGSCGGRRLCACKVGCFHSGECLCVMRRRRFTSGIGLSRHFGTARPISLI